LLNDKGLMMRMFNRKILVLLGYPAFLPITSACDALPKSAPTTTDAEWDAEEEARIKESYGW
jgi:hypothetical protein